MQTFHRSKKSFLKRLFFRSSELFLDSRQGLKIFVTKYFSLQIAQVDFSVVTWCSGYHFCIFIVSFSRQIDMKCVRGSWSFYKSDTDTESGSDLWLCIDVSASLTLTCWFIFTSLYIFVKFPWRMDRWSKTVVAVKFVRMWIAVTFHQPNTEVQQQQFTICVQAWSLWNDTLTETKQFFYSIRVL